MSVWRLRFRLTHKVAAIAIVGILGLVTLVTIYLAGSHRLNQHRQSAAAAQRLLVLSADLNSNLLESRRSEKDFLLRNELKYVERHDQLSRRIGSNLDDIAKLAEFEKLGTIGTTAKEIRSGFAIYLSNFTSVVDRRSDLGLNEKSGLEGRLRTAVHAVEAKLLELGEPKLTVLMLMMRRHEKDFMLRRDKKYGDEMKARVAEFSAALDGLGLPSATTQDLKARLSAYQRDFFAWLDGALQLTDELTATSEAYSTIEPKIASILQSIRDRYLESSAATERVTAVTQQQILIAAGSIAAVMLAISFLLGRAVSKPLVAMTAAMVQLARGDLEAKLPGIGRKDEIGEMAAALLAFKEQAIEKNRLVGLQENARQEAIEIRKKATLDMANVVESETTSAVKAVGDTARDVRNIAEEMSKFATIVSLDTQSVAAASEEALVSAQTVSSAAEELTTSIHEINAQVSRTAEIARRAVASGDAATTTVRSLTDAVSRISDVTRLIGDIASQTNLLALNATIEAARAGESGRGFAVVAGEVKNLAAQTARSTEEINQQVAEIQAISASAVNAMSDVGVRISEIDEATMAILSAIAQQAAATQEITRNVTETATSAREVSSKIQNVSAGAAQVGTQATNVRQSVAEITDNIAGLQAILVRVVRTSTEDANRRKSTRYSITVKAEVLDANGKCIDGELVDISEAGAKISCSPDMHVGDEGCLRLQGISSPLPFVVRAQQDEALHVEFVLTEAQDTVFAQWFGSRIAA